MSEPTPRIPRPGPRPLTYADYLELPDDGKRYEILDGELFVTASPRLRHQRVAARLIFIIMEKLEQTGQGVLFPAPTDLLLDDHNVLVPDLLFVRDDRREILQDQYVKGPPDLVVEIASPSTSNRDRTKKSELYSRFGVSHYWIADPATCRLEIFRLEQGAYRLVAVGESPEVVQAPGFEGLELDLGEIFLFE